MRLPSSTPNEWTSFSEAAWKSLVLKLWRIENISHRFGNEWLHVSSVREKRILDTCKSYPFEVPDEWDISRWWLMVPEISLFNPSSIGVVLLGSWNSHGRRDLGAHLVLTLVHWDWHLVPGRNNRIQGADAPAIPHATPCEAMLATVTRPHSPFFSTTAVEAKMSHLSRANLPIQMLLDCTGRRLYPRSGILGWRCTPSTRLHYKSFKRCWQWWSLATYILHHCGYSVDLTDAKGNGQPVIVSVTSLWSSWLLPSSKMRRS